MFTVGNPTLGFPEPIVYVLCIELMEFKNLIFMKKKTSGRWNGVVRRLGQKFPNYCKNGVSGRSRWVWNNVIILQKNLAMHWILCTPDNDNYIVETHVKYNKYCLGFRIWEILVGWKGTRFQIYFIQKILNDIKCFTWLQF